MAPDSLKFFGRHSTFRTGCRCFDALLLKENVSSTRLDRLSGSEKTDIRRQTCRVNSQVIAVPNHIVDDRHYSLNHLPHVSCGGNGIACNVMCGHPVDPNCRKRLLALSNGLRDLFLNDLAEFIVGCISVILYVIERTSETRRASKNPLNRVGLIWLSHSFQARRRTRLNLIQAARNDFAAVSASRLNVNFNRCQLTSFTRSRHDYLGLLTGTHCSVFFDILSSSPLKTCSNSF